MVALNSPKKGAISADRSQSSVAHQTPVPTRTKASTSSKASRSSSRPSRHHSSPASSSGNVKSVPLVVLNNTTTTGLAKQAAAQFEAGGWTVTSTGNLTNDIASTCAYYDPSQQGAQAAAEALMAQFPTIKRTKPKFPELPPGPVVVVLTPDYSTG